MPNHPHIVAHAVQDFSEWIKTVDTSLGLNDPDTAYAVLRGVLHQLRDRITTEEAIHLGDQLPTLVRGVYYEAFTPSAPQKQRTADAFLERVAARIGRDQVDPDAATRTVFALLREKCSEGEVDQVIHMLPDEVKSMWRPAA